jgi:hypothetical protein
VRHHVVGELVLVERAAGDREVVHRLLGRQPEGERHVPELQVEVDDEHLLPREGERRGEVARRERLARAALRAEHADEPALPPLARGPVTRPPGDRLAHREAQLFLGLREDRHVRRADLERPPEEPVRRGGREDDDRHVRRRAMRAVDDLQRAVVLAALAGDDEHVRALRLERTDRLVEAVRHPEQLEARVVGQGPLDVEGVEPLDCDDCANCVIHGPVTARSSAGG